MKKLPVYILIITLLCSFDGASLKGVWQYCGGIYNGKKAEASTSYTLQRTYTKSNYESIVLEPGEKPFKYEEGDYELKADTCLDTQTFSAQESQTKGITIKYNYAVSNDTLTLKGTLPNGITVEEYWKKVK